MPGLWFYLDPIDRLHQENLQFLQAQRFKHYHYSSLERMVLCHRAEDKVIKLAKALGYRVNRTVKNAPFDLWIEGCRVEVKASKWYDSQKGGRYQAAIRNHNCDLVVFDCVNGTDHLHFIPSRAVGKRRNIAVWSYAPEKSTGQWRPFLEETGYLEEAVKAACHTWQPPLL